MATLDGLARQLSLIRKSVKPVEPVQNYLDSDEWRYIVRVMRDVLQSYPDALQAAEQMIAGLPASMRCHDVHCLLARALDPYVDARVELAEKLVGPV